MDFFLSGSEGVTGLCRWQLRRARSQFLFQSTKISSQEHWLQSFGKANWIVLYFSDSSSLGAPKAGALPETHHHFGGRRSVGAFSSSAFSSHRATGNTEEFQNFRFSACQHFHSAPLRALPPYCATLRLPPLGYTFVFPFGHALSRGCSLPLMSPFGLPSAGYPASARWHAFRPPRPCARSFFCSPASRRIPIQWLPFYRHEYSLPS